MKKYLGNISVLIFCFVSMSFMSAQKSDDWTVTDVSGNEHTLYEDYLDKGEVVVLKFFFVDCPPCNAIAPSVQTLYEDWGEGTQGVEFFDITILGGDDDNDVTGFKNRHDLTFPSISSEGNALGVAQPYLDGDFGDALFTPSFAVIAPDGDVTFRVPGSGPSVINNLDDAIEEAMGSVALPSVFNIQVTDAFGTAISGVTTILTDANNSAVSYPLDMSTPLSILNISEDYPGVTDPVVTFEKVDDIRSNITPLDLLLIRKHILGIIPINDPKLLSAADTNGDDSITPLDMLVLQKVILGIFTEFPIDSYQFNPAQIPLNLAPGQSQDIKAIGIKTGDLNGF